MKKRSILLGALVFLALAVGFGLAGCTTFQASGLQMGLVINGQRYERVGFFSDKIWTNKFLGAASGATLFNLSSNATDPKVREVVEQNIKKYAGDGAVDVKITYGPSFLQLLLNCITFGIWNPGTATVEGTVVKAVN
jgi:hypothetical protein